MCSTKRLTIRKLESRDLDALTELFACEKAMRFFGPRRAMSRDETGHWLDNQLCLQDNTLTRFAVELTESAKLISVCGFQRLGEVWDFGYYFRKSFWGNGYATEACMCLLNAVLELIGDEPYQIFIESRNVSSRKVIEKCKLVECKSGTQDGERGSFYGAAYSA